MSWEYWVILIESSIILVGAGVYIGSYIDNRRAQDSFEQYDDLTGDLNREAMMSMGQSVLKDAQKYCRTFSVAMLDLDNFALVNQTFGKHRGDDVLKKVAELLRKELRQADKISRWRGEGWLVLMPDSRAEEGKNVFMRLQQALIESQFSLPQNWSVTVCMGIAEKQDHDREFDDVIKRADTALVKAKQRGKNTFLVYSSD